jgi:DUF4097 and DUF4098 domain-containing protein YvlB
VLKKLALCLLTTASLASSACTIDVQGEGYGKEVVVREQKRITLTGMPNVTIRTFDGSIELRPWDRDEILLDIERRASTSADARDIVVDATEAGGNVLIEAKRPRRSRDFHFGGWSSPRVRLTVTVPRNLDVEARSGDGSILARDLKGRIELRTGDGAVGLQRVEGEIHVSTGDGSVSARDLQGILSVTTGDGAVDLSGRFYGLIARTGDGGIRVDAREGSETQNEWRISTGDGAVTLRLPPDFNANVDAHTGDGPISASGVSVTSSSEARERGTLRGQIGKGGGVVTLRTGDGGINIMTR